jgi:hypothetical protein
MRVGTLFSGSRGDIGFLLTAAGDVEHARVAAWRATTLNANVWRQQFRLAVACWGDARSKPRVARCRSSGTSLPPISSLAMVFIARQMLL